MYRVVSPEWKIVIEDMFGSAAAAYHWAWENCGSNSCWGGIWAIQYYEHSDDPIK